MAVRFLRRGGGPNEMLGNDDDEPFNPTDLGAMLMSVAGFTLPSKEEIEQSLNTFWNRAWWMCFGGGGGGGGDRTIPTTTAFVAFASLSCFVLALVAVVLLGMKYDISRLAMILKEAARSSRQNLSANSIKSIWFTLSSLVFARELVKAVKRKVFKRRLRRQRELRRRLHQQQQQQREHREGQQTRDGEGGSGSRSENMDDGTGATTRGGGARRRLEKISEDNSTNNSNSSSKTTESTFSSMRDEGGEQNSSSSPKAAPKGNLPRRGSMLGLFVKESRKHSHQEAFFDDRPEESEDTRAHAGAQGRPGALSHVCCVVAPPSTVTLFRRREPWRPCRARGRLCAGAKACLCLAASSCRGIWRCRCPGIMHMVHRFLRWLRTHAHIHSPTHSNSQARTRARY